MISTNDVRPGMTLDLDGELFSIVDYRRHKPGKDHAMVRTKLKNVRTGAVLDCTFRAGERVELARVDRREMRFLHSDDGGFVFMDNESYDQIHIGADLVGDAAKFLKGNQVVQIPMCQGSPIGIELPAGVDLTITQTDPGLREHRGSAGTKPATLETGAVVQVPLFISTGETVRIDTRTGAYMTRAR